MTNRLDEATRFFENLYGDDEGTTLKLATAGMTDRGKRTQKWHDAPNRLRINTGNPEMAMGRLESFIRRANKGEEIFFAPTPMSGQSGRKKEQALPSRLVFGDADNGLSEEARSRLVELDATLIRSGGSTPVGPKYHVYIRLSQAVPPHELERLNRGLKALIDGDKFDCTTVLRIPGTINHKYPAKPLVTIERLSETRHHPKNVAKWLAIPDTPSHEGVAQLDPLVLPKLPKDFDRKRREYWRMRKVVGEWNSRFAVGNCRRYMAAIAIVKDAIKSGLDVNVAYAFASECEPLLDKAEEENGYDIRKDIARIYRRESSAVPSGTLTADDIVSTPQAPDVKDRPTREPEPPAVEIVPPKAFKPEGDGPSPYSSGGSSRMYLDMAIFTSGNFRPPEPEYFAVGDFHLLYRGMTHCIFGDSGSGKTWIVLAQIAMELRAGRRVKYIDFENGAMTIGHRLRNILGVPEDLLTPDRFRYMWFTEKPDESELQDEAEEGHDLVIIDGVDASLAMWGKAMNSATEVREWYDSFPQKFANEESTVMVIDHTSKGNRDKVDPRHQEPGGAPAKLAVLTGAAYFVKPEENRELVPGERGVVQAYITRKDKDGFLKSKARKDGHLFNFIIDTVNGQTVVEFESAKDRYAAPAPPPTLTDEEREILEVLSRATSPMTVTKIKEGMTRAGGTVSAAISILVTRGYVNQEAGSGRSKLNAITSEGAAVLHEDDEPGGMEDGKELDFSQVKDRRNAGPKRECRKCGELEYLVRPDEIGYQPGRPLCPPCASESIESETHIPRDGAEWARKKRESIERSRRTR